MLRTNISSALTKAHGIRAGWTSTKFAEVISALHRSLTLTATPDSLSEEDWAVLVDASGDVHAIVRQDLPFAIIIGVGETYQLAARELEGIGMIVVRSAAYDAMDLSMDKTIPAELASWTWRLPEPDFDHTKFSPWDLFYFTH